MHGARAVEVTSVGQALEAIELGQQRRCCSSYFSNRVQSLVQYVLPVRSSRERSL